MSLQSFHVIPSRLLSVRIQAAYGGGGRKGQNEGDVTGRAKVTQGVAGLRAEAGLGGGEGGQRLASCRRRGLDGPPGWCQFCCRRCPLRKGVRQPQGNVSSLAVLRA